jgi:hypothetical protein
VVLGLPDGLVPVVELAEGAAAVVALADGAAPVVALAEGVAPVVALAEGAAAVALAEGVAAVVALADGAAAAVALAGGVAAVVALAGAIVALATRPLVPEAATPGLYSRAPGSLQATHARTDSNGRATRVRGVVGAMVVLLVANACSLATHPSRWALGTLAGRNLQDAPEKMRAGACKLPQC